MQRRVGRSPPFFLDASSIYFWWAKAHPTTPLSRLDKCRDDLFVPAFQLDGQLGAFDLFDLHTNLI